MQLQAALTALDDESILAVHPHASGGMPSLTGMAAVLQQRGRFQVMRSLVPHAPSPDMLTFSSIEKRACNCSCDETRHHFQRRMASALASMAPAWRVQVIVRAFRDRVRGRLAGQLEQLAGKGTTQPAGASHTASPDMRAVHTQLDTLQQLIQVRRQRWQAPARL